MSRLGLPLSSILRVITQTNLSPRNIPPINGPIKELQTSNRLIIRHLMTSLIDPGEREVPILPALAVLDPINDHRDVPCVPELLGVRVLDGLGHRFPAKPVADVVCVAVDEGDADGQVEDLFEVVDEVGPDEVTGLLEGVVDGLAGGGVVEVHTDGLFDGVLLEVFAVVSWGAFALLICCGLVFW